MVKFERRFGELMDWAYDINFNQPWYRRLIEAPLFYVSNFWFNLKYWSYFDFSR